MRSFTQTLLASGSLMAFAARAADDSLASMTLADFADMDTDEIKALDSLLFPAGVYGVRITQAQLGMNESDPNKIDEKTGLPYPPLFYVEFKYEVLEAEPIDRSLDVDSLVGRVITDRHTFWPSNFKDQIGLLKGKYKKAGLSIDGKVGGMEGGEPGWIDGAVDHIMVLRVKTSKPNSEGMQRNFYDWAQVQSAEDAEAA